MRLPGGLIGADGSIDRTFAWKPVDGTVELALATAAQARRRPEAVSIALAGALAELAGAPASRERVDALGVPDRRFLMIELAHLLGLSFVWCTDTCVACRAPFDFPLDLHALPVAPASDSYPRAIVTTTRGRLCVRVPTGADQIRVAAAEHEAAAARLLVTLCISSCDGGASGAVIDQLSVADLVVIDRTLEDLAPKLAWAAQASCPECGCDNVFAIDVAAWLAQMADGPTADVHEIALAYGWSERDILTLTRAQRLKYLSLIRDHMHPS